MYIKKARQLMSVMFDLKSKCCHAAQVRHGILCFLALDEALPKAHRRIGSVSGFTLLEMLVVIALLGVVMLTATTLIVNTGETERDDATRVKWAQVRMAVVGDMNRTLNSAPALSGYVADMGRLPANLNELIQQGTQPAWGELDLTSVSPSTGVNGKLWGGWRGPYLYTAGSSEFRDGWDNVDSVSAQDAVNFGWQVTHAPVACTVPDCTDMVVQSLGDGGQPGGAEFAADFPEAGISLVRANEWQISAASIGFNVVLNKPPTTDQNNLKLRIYFFEDTALQDEYSEPFNHLSGVAGVTQHSVAITPTGPATEISLPMGKYAAVVWCDTQSRVYSGNCAGTDTIKPYYFTLLPNTTLPITIPWNIP